jgi:adenosylcobinamide-GDP ribazoletransferase
MGAAVGLLPISLMPQVALMSILVFLGVFELGRRYFLRRLGGYTGDCLGAIQQITELCLLMGIVVQCRFG